MRLARIVAALTLTVGAVAVAPVTAQAAVLEEYHVVFVSDYKYGGVKLFSDGRLEVCDDHSDGHWIHGAIYNEDLNKMYPPAGVARPAIVDTNGHKAGCAWEDMSWMLRQHDYITVMIGISNDEYAKVTYIDSSSRSGYFSYVY